MNARKLVKGRWCEFSRKEYITEEDREIKKDVIINKLADGKAEK